MAGKPQFGPAPDPAVRPLTTLPPPQGDPPALLDAVDDALAAGRHAGAVYAAFVRPLLAPVAAAAAVPATGARHAVARSQAQAALAALACRHPTSDEGLGRRAAVLQPSDALGELDARMLGDVLEAAGWTIALVALDQEAAAVVAAIDDARAELVVLPAADAAHVQAAQAACRLLRLRPHPPLVVGVAFDAGAEPPALGADHFVGTAEALPALLRRRMGGGPGPTRWGVRLAREDGGLVVAPVGVLDAASAGRLRAIVDSRRTLYPRIVIDLRELQGADARGLGALAAWDAEIPWDPTVAARGDERALTALRDAGFAGPLSLR